jgi:serine/threonine protein kinase
VEVGCLNQTDVAVKILTEEHNGSHGSTSSDGPAWDEARLRALRQEVGILGNLRHPNVVLFMGVCLSPPAVVTEYCPLGSLYDVLKKVTAVVVVVLGGGR